MAALRIEIPWKKYGTIAYIAEKLHGNALGKTALQKLIYFIQEWKNVPLGYDFEFYTYGPFSSDLMGDLDYTQSLGAVSVEYIINGGYSISPAAENAEIQKRASVFLANHASDIQKVIDMFGKYAAWELELRATIHFAYREMVAKPTPFADSDIITVIHSLKPDKFTDAQIEQAISELREHGVIGPPVPSGHA